MQQVELRPVDIPVDVGRLDGTLSIPQNPTAVVLFAHGSGSSRLSPRNTFVADALRSRAIATLLFDLLTPVEDAQYRNRFEIDLLTKRLLTATDWLRGHADLAPLPLGYFGASTGAAAAVRAACRLENRIAALVSRGGRPDLAGRDALVSLGAPTLLLVGGRDMAVIALNREAFALMKCEKQLRVIPGASHLFEEPGTLEQVAQNAADWFDRHLTPAGR
ncbi:MAG: dienelactone hydrolase family protein [Burkholderiales bacterium]